MSGKYSTLGYLSKCCFQCASYLLERNFEHSCDQVTFKMPLSKKMLWQWRKSVSSKRPFLPLVLNKNNNNKHAEYHGIFILFKVQIYWKQGSHISLLFGTGLLLNHFSCLEEANISTVNTNLIKFVGDQRLHKNITLIMCFWMGLAILCLQERYCCSEFPLTSYRFSLVQQFLSSLPRIRSRQNILIHQEQVSFL